MNLARTKIRTDFVELFLKILGLVDSVDCNQFDKRTAQLEEKWNRIAPGFHVWFLRQKAEVFNWDHLQRITLTTQI